VIQKPRSWEFSHRATAVRTGCDAYQR
jgi:hypothetical protein